LPRRFFHDLDLRVGQVDQFVDELVDLALESVFLLRWIFFG